MDLENKVSIPKGYCWRSELINILLPYVKDGVDQKFLMNLIRGYVPAFFPTKLKYCADGTWLFPLSLKSNHYWWKTEIENIGKNLVGLRCRLDDKLVKKVFQNNNWEIDVPVEGISIVDKRGRWKYDALKNKIAVEVELSSRSQVYKDAFKFLIGQAMGQVSIGIIMVGYHREGNKPHLGSVDPDSHPIFTTLPMLKVAFHGFPNIDS